MPAENCRTDTPRRFSASPPLQAFRLRQSSASGGSRVVDMLE